MGLLEAVVDRAADHLESVSLVIDKTSHEIFHEESKRPRGRDFHELLRRIGEEGDFNSKLRRAWSAWGNSLPSSLPFKTARPASAHPAKSRRT